jgi:hypothetical protein
MHLPKSEAFALVSMALLAGPLAASATDVDWAVDASLASGRLRSMPGRHDLIRRARTAAHERHCSAPNGYPNFACHCFLLRMLVSAAALEDASPVPIALPAVALIPQQPARDGRAKA